MGFANPPATLAGGQYIRSATLVVAASDSKDTRNVDYVCDGTDDQVEINQAIVALPAGGGLIHLLEGTYNVSDSITIDRNNVAILGAGANTVIRVSDTPFGVGGAAIIADNRSNLLVADLRIDGNRANQAIIVSGIRFRAVTYSKIVNCWVEDTRLRGIELGIYLGTNSYYNTVTGNTCQGNLESGIYLVGGGHNTVTGNTCRNNDYYGISIQLGSNFNTVTGNTCQGNGRVGIFLSNNSYNNIVGNTCEENNRYGIWLHNGASHNAIMDNTVINNGLEADNTYDGINVDLNCDYNDIQGNTVRTTIAAPPPNRQRYGINIVAATCDGNAVVNNDLYQSGQTGGYNDAGTNTRGTADGQWPVGGGPTAATLVVAATDSIDPTRADYQCDGASDETEINAAITALGAIGGTVKLLEGTFTVDGSIILAADVALVGQGAGTVITIPNGHDAAINIIASASDYVLIKDLQVDGNRANQAAGVMNGISFATVTHSRVEGCWIRNMYGGSAIYIRDTNTYNIIVNNTIYNNGGYGIHLAEDSDHNTIADNEIINNGLDADVTYDGIFLSASDYNSIQGNLIRTTVAANRHRYGINISNATCNENLVKDNDLHQSGQTAFFNDVGTDTKLPELWVNSIFDDSDANVTLSNIGDHVSLSLADAIETLVHFNFRVPSDFHELVRARIVVVPLGTGNLSWAASTDWGLCNEAYNAGSDVRGPGSTAVVVNQIACLDMNVALDGITAGDHVGVAFTRLGDDPGDTVNAAVHLLQFWMQYV